MITVQPHAESGDAEIHYDDETIQGHYVHMRVDDDAGMGLLFDLFKFYEGKGYKPIMSLQAMAKPSWFQRFKLFLKGA